MNNLTKKEGTQSDYRNIDMQIKEAEAFFNDPKLADFTLKEDDNPYADKDGLVEFICGVELSQDPIIHAKLDELKSFLISITAIVTAYVYKYAAQNGENYKTDLDLWAKILSKIPLMGPVKKDQQTYSRNAKGVEIAGDLINLILGVSAVEGNGLNSFKSFLEKQGNALRAGIEENKDSYKTITVGVAVEVTKNGEQIIYIPKIKLYQVNFNSENSAFSSSCGSNEEVAIHFDYLYGAGSFDYESLRDPETRIKFDKFIAGTKKAQIEDATTFFNDDFETE